MDPNRRAALCASIIVGLRSVDLGDSIVRNVAAIKEKLAEHAEFIAANGPIEPPVELPPLPEKEIPTRVENRHNPLRH